MPILIDILEGRWRLIDHTLRLSDEASTIKAMRIYFERSKKEFRGRPGETIETALNKDRNQ